MNHHHLLIKGIQIGKELKVHLFTGDIILHIKNPKGSKRKTTRIDHLLEVQPPNSTSFGDQNFNIRHVDRHKHSVHCTKNLPKTNENLFTQNACINVPNSVIYNKPKQKQSKCLSTCEYMNNMQYINTMEYYSRIKRNELPIHITT